MPHPLLRRPLLHLLLPALALILLILSAYSLRTDPRASFLLPAPQPAQSALTCPNPDDDRELLFPPRLAGDTQQQQQQQQLRYLLLPADTPPPPPPRIRPVPSLPADLLWTWVNGTDPLQLAASRAAALAAGNTPAKSTAQAASKQYRENGELLYSVRSALASVGPWARAAHIVVADYNLTECVQPSWRDDNGTVHLLPAPETRIAQLPQWLRPLAPGDRWRDAGTGLALDVVSHWQLGLRQDVFNSFAIEAALGQVPGLADHFIYLNDDYFLLLPLSAASFFTRPYGLVFRFQADLLVRGTPTPRASSTGEWAALEWSNSMLNARFGERQRPYVIHVAKGMSRPLVEELQLLFAPHFADTRQHAFRSTTDAYLGFLFPHFVVERHREALLWSFLVLKLGGDSDEWGEQQMEDAWRLLGGAEGDEYYADLEVARRPRATLAEGRVSRVLGEEPRSTVYKFSSHDGYPYTLPSRPAHSFPVFPAPAPGAQHSAAPACTLEFELCLGTDGEPSAQASGVFKRVAFELPHCGDCLVTALVGQSGLLGLSAFLPDAEPGAADGPLPEGLVPVLPLTPTWQSADFTLSAILPPGPAPARPPRRALALALLARYTYTLADTPLRFASLRTPSSAKQLLAAIDKDSALAMACMNDDIVSRPDDVRRVVAEWLQRRWGKRRDWERGSWW
ncbi:hypothetical protein CALCODRAFT_558137 [Calocera cornea HHB12733]|uniref:Stealth protein CR3 conserved region 3 domain-containing protein n=1 Tax=Calocera cornea HHB12733 TaxID=1353952 RepID=A0A165D8B1_9BASI|nr:hypothetical protein CALCODRAFT_558137 [Calocera cornea HHB12733]